MSPVTQDCSMADVVSRTGAFWSWRALFIEACKAFEAERPGIWLDLEHGVAVPELDAMREERA